jgi:hypothetical protein
LIITKKMIDDNRFAIELANEEGNSMTIEYGGADLYWIMNNYHDNNLFKITPQDNFLFLQMDELFKQIAKYDDPYNKVLNNNCFEWISEAYGLPEEANKLTIKKKQNSYEISFFNNPNYSFKNKNICCICFCLSGSQHQEIAYAFSSMFLEYTHFENQQQKILKKQK